MCYIFFEGHACSLNNIKHHCYAVTGRSGRKCNIHLNFKITHESPVKFPAFSGLFHLTSSGLSGAKYVLSSVLGELVNRKSEIREALTN